MSQELETLEERLQEAKAERDRLILVEHSNAQQIEKLRNDVFGEDDQTKKASQLRELLRKKFNQNSGEDHLMNYEEFCKAIGVPPPPVPRS